MGNGAAIHRLIIVRLCPLATTNGLHLNVTRVTNVKYSTIRPYFKALLDIMVDNGDNGGHSLILNSRYLNLKRVSSLFGMDFSVVSIDLVKLEEFI